MYRAERHEDEADRKYREMERELRAEQRGRDEYDRGINQAIEDGRRARTHMKDRTARVTSRQFQPRGCFRIRK